MQVFGMEVTAVGTVVTTLYHAIPIDPRPDGSARFWRVGAPIDDDAFEEVRTDPVPVHPDDPVPQEDDPAADHEPTTED